ncbi:MAG: FAD-binding oxidoreductase [Candidatus Methylomirabilia bacterium]
MEQALIEKVRGIVGSEHVLTGVDLSPYVLEGRTPEVAAFPGSVEEVSELLVLASEAGISVIPWGGGTKIEVGAPPSALGLVLGVKRLNRLLEHEPGDLTATVEVGMTLEELQARLGQQGQWLSLDPAFGNRATIGGILAANASGPRRHLYGTARDLLIGITVVAADGSVVRGGGKVVKNVAGYDLPKLYIGSFGTLGVIVQATFKLRPLPDDDRLFLACFDRLKECGLALRALMASDLIPSAVELLDAEVLRAAGLAGGGGEGGALVVGFDGLTEQVAWQCEEARRLFSTCGLVGHRILQGPEREQAWRALRELRGGAMADPLARMRFGVLPMQVAEVVEQTGSVAQTYGLRAACCAHAGVGVIRAVLGGSADSVASVVAALREWREVARAAGGHALLEWAPLGIKEAVAAWDPPGPAFRIMERIKAKLDPKGILNPGRYVGGI